MIQSFKNIPIRYKLITSFGLVIAINAVFGVFSLRIMRQLGDLVNVTYDKALMSGTFAQAAKFNFAIYDAQTRAGLFADDANEFRKAISRSEKALETLEEDLVVVSERTLSDKSNALIDDVRPALTFLRTRHSELTLQKKLSLGTQSREHAMGLVKSWNEAIGKSGLYRKLTALYDDAAELGYEFRMASEEKTQKIIYQSLAILVSCIVISLLLSFAVAYFLILPLFRLNSVCKKVADGDYTVRASVGSLDELGMLASSFNSMLTTIQKKDENIAALLASLPFGLFYIDEQGSISKERSPATNKLFEDFENYANLLDFFSAHNVSTHTVADILKATFQKLLPFNSAVFLFPDRIETQVGAEVRTIQLTYKPHYGPKKKLERIILLAEDVTEKNRALDESRSLTERVERISKVAADIPGFKEFLQATAKLYDSTLAQLGHPQQSADLARDLHSLKGLLGVYAFTACAASIHDFESHLLTGTAGSVDSLRAELNSSRTMFDEQSRDILEVLTIDAARELKYFDAKKISHLKQIVLDEGNQRILRLISELDRFPLSKVFVKYGTHAQSVVKKFDDKKVNVSFAASDEISFDEAQRLDSALVHLLNNSIDHGIETSLQRREVGKSDTGEIRITCRRKSDEGLELKLSDDGQGINVERLVAKAVEHNIMTPQEAQSASNERKLNLIFAAGLSTKDEASSVSGRGVGMDAVKSYIESLGGSIELHSQLHVGTTFVIHVPPLEKNP